MDRRPTVLTGTVAFFFAVAVWLATTSGCSSSPPNHASDTGGGSGGVSAGSGGAPAGTGGASTSTSGGSAGTSGASAGADAGSAGTGGASAGAGGSGAAGGTYPLPVDAGQTGFLTWTYNGQPVGFHLPEPTDHPLPVVMFLHGCGGNPVDPNWWIIDALNEIEPCAVLLPFRPADESPTCSAWGGTYDDDLRPAMVDALAGLNSVMAQYGLDRERQYLYGESMGAEGVLQLLVQFPTRFAGAVVVAGYTLDKGAEQMAQTPLWLIHGSADTTNPPETIETIHQSILDAGGTLVKFTEYDGAEHNPSITRARSEPGLLDWLLAQRHDGILRDVPVEEDPGDEVTVTFDVTDIDAAYEGMPVDLGLLGAGAADCQSWASATAYAGQGTVTAGACNISIPFVQEGTYTACAIIDVDGNAQPSPGDLAGQLPLVVAGDTAETWSAADWIEI